MAFGFGPLPGSTGGITAEDLAALFSPAGLAAQPKSFAQPAAEPTSFLERRRMMREAEDNAGQAGLLSGNAMAPPMSFGPMPGAPQQDAPAPEPLQMRGIRPDTQPATQAEVQPPIMQMPPLSLGPLPGATAPSPEVPEPVRGGPVLPDFQPAPLPARAATPAPASEAVSQADMPAPNAVPTQGQAPEGPSFLDRLGAGIGKNGDLLIGLGTGLMSTHGFGNGLSAGFQNAQKASALTATSDLAKAELALKQQKLAKEGQGQNATRNYLISKGFDASLADAAMTNPTILSSTLSQLNKDPSVVEVGGKKYSLKPGERPSDANLLGDAKGADDTQTADQKNYEAAKAGGYTKSFLDYQLEKANASRAQTTVNATVNPILKGLSDQFATGAETARASADVVRAVQNARSQIDAPGGIIAGKFADERLSLQKLGAAFGVTDPQAIANTETFRTQIKPIVLETVKGLGAGSGVSNADRDFALQAVGGDINLDPITIRRVLDITEKAARSKIDRHNTLADQMVETQPELKQAGPMLRIAIPPTAEPVQQQPSAPNPANDPLGAARAAIARGAPRDAVLQRLLRNGVDPKGL